MKAKKYWERNRLASIPASYHLAFGKRSNGKTYQGKMIFLGLLREQVKNIKEGMVFRKFLYVRRLKKHIVERNAMKVFVDVQELYEDELGSIVRYDRRTKSFYLEICDIRYTIGYISCVEEAFDEKGIALSDVDVMVFDEFMDYSYMDDEITKFLHLMSTLTRNGERKVDVWLFANTISKWCPYFDLFGINISKLKPGNRGRIVHKRGVTVAFEYTADKHVELEGVKRHPYLGFDDTPEANMILYGDFETKKANTFGVDGITWNSERVIIPAYLTGMEMIFEMSIYTKGNYPIAFVRKVNTQDGKVSKYLRFNISADNTVFLNNKKGVVPIFNKISPLIDEDVMAMLTLLRQCYSCGRIVYSDLMVATDFETLLSKVI